MDTYFKISKTKRKTEKNKELNVSICSYKELKEYLHEKDLKGYAVISFYNSTGKPLNISTLHKTSPQMLFFAEVDDIDFDELEEFNLTLDKYFPEASELAKFIYEAYNNELNIICQCEYGQSRSAGCAAAILEHFNNNGIAIFKDYNYYPNKLIFNKLCESLKTVQKTASQ